jgi:hypothetical protein
MRIPIGETTVTLALADADVDAWEVAVIANVGGEGTTCGAV